MKILLPPFGSHFDITTRRDSATAQGAAKDWNGKPDPSALFFAEGAHPNNSLSQDVSIMDVMTAANRFLKFTNTLFSYILLYSPLSVF